MHSNLFLAIFNILLGSLTSLYILWFKAIVLNLLVLQTRSVAQGRLDQALLTRIRPWGPSTDPSYLHTWIGSWGPDTFLSTSSTRIWPWGLALPLCAKIWFWGLAPPLSGSVDWDLMPDPVCRASAPYEPGYLTAGELPYLISGPRGNPTGWMTWCRRPGVWPLLV